MLRQMNCSTIFTLKCLKLRIASNGVRTTTLPVIKDVLEYTVVIKMRFVKYNKIDFALTSGSNELFI